MARRNLSNQFVFTAIAEPSRKDLAMVAKPHPAPRRLVACSECAGGWTFGNDPRRCKHCGGKGEVWLADA